jgi:hypothetical protein
MGIVLQNHYEIGRGLEAGRKFYVAWQLTKPLSLFNLAWHPKTNNDQEGLGCSRVEYLDPGRKCRHMYDDILFPDQFGLGVLNQNPNYCLPIIGRHHVVESDGRSCGRKPIHLPNSALRAPFARMSLGSDWFPRHDKTPFRKNMPRREFIERQMSIAYYHSWTEPQGFLFVGRRVSSATHYGRRECSPTHDGFFLFKRRVFSCQSPPQPQLRESVVL